MMFTGPNFDYTYYITVNGVVGSFISLLSVILSEFLFSDWKFRPLIMVTIVIGALASVFDWIVIKRWNIELGLPDKIFFLFGNTIVGTIVNSLQFIPLSAMYAKMSPEGMEAAIVGEMILELIGCYYYNISLFLNSFFSLCLWHSMFL
jgi:hypothetical protein